MGSLRDIGLLIPFGYPYILYPLKTNITGSLIGGGLLSIAGSLRNYGFLESVDNKSLNKDGLLLEKGSLREYGLLRESDNKIARYI